MKLFTLSILLFFFILSCGDTENFVDNKDGGSAKIEGKKIYKIYCITCHGFRGDMGANGAFNLAQSKLSLEERVQTITNGRNTMTPFSGLLNEEEIKAVAEYTLKLSNEK